MSSKSGVSVTRDQVEDLLAAMEELASLEVLVGVPESEADRDDDDQKEPVTNAALLYIHDHGAPEANIPARPSMLPGIERVEDQIGAALYQGAKAATQLPNPRAGKTARRVLARLEIEKAYHRAGMLASTSIKNVISQGIGPALADSTLRNRAQRGRKGAQEELDRRAQGEQPGIDLAKPLVDTGEMRAAITYVIRPRADRKEES